MARPKAFDEIQALEKAMQVFWKKGYNATSMEDLLSAMGINRASLYDTFGDKKQLYLAALRQFQAESGKKNTFLLRQAIHSPKSQLMAILSEQLEQSLRDADNKGCMIVNATAEMALLDADVNTFVKNNLQNVEELFERLIREGQEIGEFNPNTPPQYAAAFLANFLNGMRVVSKTQPDPDKMRASLDLAIGAL